MNEPNDVIELLIYCHYILGLKQACVIGVLTDGANWHGIYMKKADDGTMKMFTLHHC